MAASILLIAEVVDAVVVICKAVRADRTATGFVQVAWRRSCVGSAIVFCCWTSKIAVEWLRQGCESDLSTDFPHFGGGDFPFKIPLKSASNPFLFLLWHRDPVLELQFLKLLHVILLCFATRSLQASKLLGAAAVCVVLFIVFCSWT